MANLNENQEYAISKFLERYDYDARYLENGMSYVINK